MMMMMMMMVMVMVMMMVMMTMMMMRRRTPTNMIMIFMGVQAREKGGVQAAKFRVYKGVVVRLARADTRLQKYIFSGSSETIGQAKTDLKKLCSWHLGSARC